MGRSRPEDGLPLAQVEAEHDPLSPDRRGDRFQGAERRQRFQPHDDARGAVRDGLRRARGSRGAAVDEHSAGQTGERLHQDALPLPARDRIEVRDVALVAAEPLTERACQRECVSRPPGGHQYRLDRRVGVPQAAVRQHGATRLEIERRDHAHGNALGRARV